MNQTPDLSSSITEALPEISFDCPCCKVRIVAGYEHGGTCSACPSCGNRVVVPLESDPRDSKIRPVADLELPPVPKAPQGSKTRVFRLEKTMIVALLGAAAWMVYPYSCSALPPRVGLIDPSPSAGDNQSGGPTFWRFRFGDSFDKCSKTMTDMKREGQFNELQVGEVVFGWMPGATTITGSGRSDLGGMLRIPCDEVKLYFKNDVLVGVAIIHLVRTRPDPSMFGRLTEDAANYLDVPPTAKVVADEVGNRTKYANIERGGMTIEIQQSLEGPAAVFPPNMRLYPTPH